MNPRGNVIKRSYAAILLASVYSLCQSTAFANCADDWLRVDEIRGDNGIELRATNDQEFPITYSVRVRSDSFSRGRKSIRGTLDGHESEPLIVVPADEPLRVSCSWTIGDDEATHDDDHIYR